MKTSHLFAVGIAAAMAVGAAGGYGLSQFTQVDGDVVAATAPATTDQTPLRHGSSVQTGAPPAGTPAWERNLMIATGDTLDSLGMSKIFIENAGVPSVIQRNDGSLLAAFQWFPEDNEDAFDKVAVSASTDGGTTWSDPELVVVEGLPDGYQRPFDPTLVTLDDGSVRLYFTSSTEEKPKPGQSMKIYVATSEDGVTYVYDGEAFAVEGERAYDATVVFHESVWHIATPHAPDQGAYHGTSNDGLSFVSAEGLSNNSRANWTGNFYTLEDLVYFFGSGGSSTDGFLWFSDSNDMTTWGDPVMLDIPGGDPAAVYVPGAGWIVIYVGEPEESE